MKSVDSCIGNNLKKLGLLDKYREQRLYHGWKKIAGPMLAANCRIGGIEPPVVVIEAMNSVWLQQAAMQKEMLRKKINAFYQEELIQEVKLRMHRVKSHPETEAEIDYGPAEERRIDFSAVYLTPEDTESIKTSLQLVQDERLRDQLFRLQVRQKKREKVLLQEGYQKCSRCGTFIKSNRKICLTCAYELHRQRIIGIKGLLKAKAWAKYGEINENMTCTFDEFSEARKELIYFYVDRLHNGSTDWLDMCQTAMLVTGKQQSDLPEAFIVNLANKYRNKLKQQDEVKKE